LGNGGRLTQFEAITAAAETGLADHARWLSARAGLLRKIAGRRSSSRLPDLVELVMRRGVVSAGMVAEELKVSNRAALDLIEALGLRETTGRARYRAWGVLYYLPHTKFNGEHNCGAREIANGILPSCTTEARQRLIF